MGLQSSLFTPVWGIAAGKVVGTEIPASEIAPGIGTYGYRTIGTPAINIAAYAMGGCYLNACNDDANRDNAEVAIMRQAQYVATADYVSGAFVRGSGASGSENGYWCAIAETTGQVVIYKFVSGTPTLIGYASIPGTGAWSSRAKCDYFMRFRVNGTAIKARIWRWDEMEPTTWLIETTDSSVTGAGWCGLAMQCGATVNNGGFHNPGFVSVATAGETAPIPRTDEEIRRWMNDDSEIRVVLAEIEVLGQTSAGVANPSFVLLSNYAMTTLGSEDPPHQCYDDLIVTSPIIRAAASEQLLGRSTLTYGELVMKNEDGLRDHWLRWNWDGRSCELYFGGVGWRKWDFTKIMSGTVYEVYAPRENQIGFKIRDKGTMLNKKVQSLVIGGTDANSGAPQPITLGAVFNIEPVIKSSSSLIYKFHDQALTGTSAVAAVRDRGVALTLTTDYTVQLSNGEITLVASPAGRITMDVVNDQSVSSDAKGGNQHRRILQTLVEDRAGLGAGSTYQGARAGSLAEFGEDSVYAGLYIKDEANIAQLLDEVVISAGGFWYHNATGQFCATVLRLPSAPYDHEVIEDDIIGDLMIERIFLPSTTEQLGYQRNYSIQKDGLGAITLANRALYGAPAQYTAISPSYAGLDQPSNHQLRQTPTNRITLFRYKADAETEATRRDGIFSKLTAIVSFKTKYNAPLYELGESVWLTHRRHGFVGGGAGMVVGYEKDYEKATTLVRMFTQIVGEFPVTSVDVPVVPETEFY